MSIYASLKAAWKELGIKGKIKNYSSKDLWVLETDTSEKPIARILPPGHKTPPTIDSDAFKRVDGKAVEKHNNWWKFYDFSTVDVFDKGRQIALSVVSKTAVGENHFGKPTYRDEKWGVPLRVISDVRRDKKKKIIKYFISDTGWVDFEIAFRMTCYHEIDNARPVFPRKGNPYIRTKRDNKILNNLSLKGRT